MEDHPKAPLVKLATWTIEARVPSTMTDEEAATARRQVQGAPMEWLPPVGAVQRQLSGLGRY